MKRLLPVLFAVAILADILVAWSPRYWPTAVGIASLSVVAALWALTASDLRFPKQTLLVAAIALWGFMELAVRSSVIPVLTLRSSLVWSVCLVAFVLGSQILRSTRDRELFLKILLYALTFIAAAAILQAFIRPVRVFGIFPADDNVVGTMYYKNHFAALMELAAPIALWHIRKGNTVGGALCFAIMFAATIASLSRAGTILVTLELLIFLVLIFAGEPTGRKAAAPVAGLLLVLVAGAALVVGTDAIWGRMHETNVLERRDLPRSTIAMVAEHPLLGYGMGTWRQVYPGFAVYDMAVVANEAHNDWAQWAAEGGIPFAALMAGLVLWLAIPALRSTWAIGILMVAIHCGADYALRQPGLQFLFFAMAGGLAASKRYDPHRTP